MPLEASGNMLAFFTCSLRKRQSICGAIVRFFSGWGKQIYRPKRRIFKK
jgi:hypothetical protein